MRTTDSSGDSVDQPANQPDDPHRRNFIGSCGSAAALALAGGPSLAAAGQPLASFEPATLVGSDGKPLRADQIKPQTEYIFQYPFRSTPCFLINVGQPVIAGQQLTKANGDAYQWRGGVGPNASIVAFSAICAHKLSHPSPVVSFIGYREYPVGFLNQETKEIEERSGVIQCCSEHSIYDPTKGAQVVSGPAPQPLAAIALEVRNGVLVATGVYGGNMFEQYFERFGNRLMLEHRGNSFAEPVGANTNVVLGDAYTKNKMRCG